MKPLVCLVLLALCCALLLPREGESAGGIVLLKQAQEAQEPGMLAGEESPDDPEADGGLVIDERQDVARKSKRHTEEAALPGRVRRAPEEGKKKKKEGKKKNKEPKAPGATKKP
ncbi:hypothetical protein CRUP_002109, partial [Coryphaenoides rupestris]